MLLEVLRRHEGHDDKERRDLQHMRHFAASLPNPFSRATFPAHFTGSAVVVDPAGARVVLLLHAKLQRWLQPGGHADVADGADLSRTALREAREETGLDVELVQAAPLDVDVHTIPARRDEPQHEHLDVRYLLRALNPDALHHDAAESHGAQWLTWHDALARADEAPLQRLLHKARLCVERRSAP